MDMKTKIFVYGTLKEGQANDHYMRDATLVGAGQTNESWALVDMANGLYPAMVQDQMSVQGEVYEANESLLHELDILEGTPHLYMRYKIPITLIESGEEVSAWAYVLRHRGRYTADEKMEVWPCTE